MIVMIKLQLLPLLLLASFFTASAADAAEHIRIYKKTGSDTSSEIELKEGETAEVIFHTFKSSLLNLHVEMEGDIYTYSTSTLASNRGHMRFTGPARIWIAGVKDAPGFVTLKKLAPPSTMVPTNTVVIPSNEEGAVRIELETSEDLVNWVPAQPGLYLNEPGNRFFRVRAIRQAGEE